MSKQEWVNRIGRPECVDRNWKTGMSGLQLMDRNKSTGIRGLESELKYKKRWTGVSGPK